MKLHAAPMLRSFHDGDTNRSQAWFTKTGNSWTASRVALRSARLMMRTYTSITWPDDPCRTGRSSTGGPCRRSLVTVSSM
jgi:hypothetical protein